MSAFLRFLYETVPGRILLVPLTSPALSKAAGAFLDSPLSLPLIRPFARKYGIRIQEYHTDGMRCFNDFFTRKIRGEYRPVDREPDSLISPCDGLLSVYRIRDGLVVPVKQSRYTISQLVEDAETARRFEGGWCLVFRLCVEHYHRYCFMDDSIVGEEHVIPGRLHTVRPVALAKTPVFTTNSREYVLMEGKNLGTYLQMEVGAMLVGRIVNYSLPSSRQVMRGDEKGRFEYGGSTVIALLREGSVLFPEELLAAGDQGRETPVKMGQKIGRILRGGAQGM